MKVKAINLSKPKEVEHNGRMILTGIFKQSVKHQVMVTRAGLEGDGQADLKAHGGPDKAIYVYSEENYRFWEHEINRSTMPFGQFGENFTVDEMTDEVVHIGDIFKIGKLLAQVTQPRVPCFKLGIKMDLATFPRQFMWSGRVGFYMRVLEEAKVNTGDSIELVSEHPLKLTIKKSMLALSDSPENKEIILHALQIEGLSETIKSIWLFSIGGFTAYLVFFALETKVHRMSSAKW